MGGGGGGKSESKSKSKTTPEQRMMWAYYFSDILPMARGEDVWYTRRMAQSARDEGARQLRMAQENIMEMGTRTGMSATQIAGLQREAQEQSLQQTLKAIAQSKQQAAAQAMQMISGLPMMGEESKSKTEQPKSYAWGLYSG